MSFQISFLLLRFKFIVFYPDGTLEAKKYLTCYFALMFLKIRVPYILKNFPGVFPFHFFEVVAK